MPFLRSWSLIFFFSLAGRAQDGLVDPADYNNIKIKFKAEKIFKFELDSSAMLSKNVKVSDIHEFLEKCQETYPLKSVDSNSHITIFFRNNSDSTTYGSELTSNLKEGELFTTCVQKKVESHIRKTNCNSGDGDVIVFPPGDYTFLRPNLKTVPEGSEVFCNEEQLMKTKPSLIKKSK